MDARESPGTRCVDFGFNYLPTVTLVEDFSPFWVESRCTLSRMRLDLLCMRALKARFVRFHLMPADAERDSLPGVDPQRSMDDLAAAARFAHEIGLAVHWDIWSKDILQVTPEEVRRAVGRLRGTAQSYQIGNEPYFRWARSPRYYDHAERLIRAGKEADPRARFSVDILPADLETVRRERPALYGMLDMVLIHYYAISDHRGWTPVYVEQLVAFCGGDARRFEALKDERFVQSEFYIGSYGGFEKEKWITEITCSGYHKFANLMPEEAKAAQWREVCEALVRRTGVARVGHHNFRDKMSWREIGQSQCGMVWMDGTPKPQAFAFRDMAARCLPESDLAKWVEISLQRSGGRLTARLRNALDRALPGKLSFESTPEVAIAGPQRDLTLPPRGEIMVEAELREAQPSRYAASHILAAFTTSDERFDARTVVGWMQVVTPRAVRFDAESPALPGVSLPGGADAIRGFFEKYPNPAVVFGNATGFDAEMAYRLKSVLQAVTGKPVEIACAADARKLLDGPLILIGNAQRNFYVGLVESEAPPALVVSATNPAFAGVIEKPFRYQDRRGAIACAIGYAYSPACLYLGGLDDAAVRRATYDVIRRIWRDASMPIRPEEPEGAAIVGTRPAIFRVRLEPGPYGVSLTLGDRTGLERVTRLDFGDGRTHGPFRAAGNVQSQTILTTVTLDHLDVRFDTEPGSRWAVLEMEIAHGGLLAEHARFTFGAATAATEGAESARRVSRDTLFTDASGYGWLAPVE